MADSIRARAVLLFDWLAAFFVVIAVAIELTGGFYTSVMGLRVSARSVDRAVVAALAVVAVRLAIGRGMRPFGLGAERYLALKRRAFDPAADRPAVLKRRRTGWAVLGICAVGAVLLFPQIRNMHAVPDLGDPLFTMWRIGWVLEQMRGDPRALFDGNIFHPDRLTLTYSDSMLLTSATAAPLLVLGFHPVVVYNLVFLSGFLLSALAAYLLACRLTGSRAAAFVAAAIFGFYPYRFEHYSHLELQMTFWMPLALLAVHRFVETAHWRYGLGASLVLAAQLYSSMYYGIFLSIFIAGLGLVLFRFSRETTARLLGRSAVGAAIAMLLAIPLARPYVAARAFKGDRGHDAVRVYSATAADYLRAHERSRLYGSRLLPGRQIERALFPGVVPIALSAAALAPPLGPIRLAYVAGLLVAFDGSLGFNGLLYPYLYEWAVPVRSMRVPARFSILVGLSLAVLAGFGARRLLENRRGWRARVVLGGLLGAIALDVWPRLELQPVWPEPPGIYATLAGDREVVLAEFPLNTDPFGFADNTPFMYFSLWHWSSMVNGYSGFIPPAYEDLAKRMNGFPDLETINLLISRGVTHVSVNCALYRRPCGEVLEPLEALPPVRLVTEAQWEGAPVRLYQLVR